MATYQILFWHDIPVQVRARDAGGRVSKPLPIRFQEAVDQAAMAAGLAGSDEYTNLFAWAESQERPGSAAEVAETLAAELDAAHATISWRATADALRARSKA